MDGYWQQITLGHVYKHHLAAAATVGAVALLQAGAADLRLRACLAFCRMSFLRIARAVAVDLSPTSQQTLWTGTVAAAAAVDLRKLPGLCPVSRGRLFLRFATVVTVTVMFLRGATVARVGIRSPGLRRWADWVTAMWIRGATRDGTAVTGIKDVTVGRVMFLSDVTVTAMLLRGAMMSFLLLRRRLRHLVFPLRPPLMRLPPFNFSPPFSCMRLWIP